jgi:hypothetical protein
LPVTKAVAAAVEMVPRTAPAEEMPPLTVYRMPDVTVATPCATTIMMLSVAGQAPVTVAASIAQWPSYRAGTETGLPAAAQGALAPQSVKSVIAAAIVWRIL